MNDRLSDDELKDLLSQKATPAPWYVRHLDNDHAMSLTAVSTVPDTGNTSVGRNLPSGNHCRHSGSRASLCLRRR
jgi:hypothetical protein